MANNPDYSVGILLSHVDPVRILQANFGVFKNRDSLINWTDLPLNIHTGEPKKNISRDVILRLILRCQP